MKARLLSPSAENIALAARALRASGVVGMPTETVYGLAGVATDEEALTRIFSTKERPTFDPLIVHVAPSAKTLEALELLDLTATQEWPAETRALVDALLTRFWPGPLTLVLPKAPRVPDLATSGLPTVALRMPDHPIAQALILASGAPLAAPSANRFGRISPTSARDVAAELGDRIEWILDGGPCRVGVESTVVAVSAQGTLTLLRPGGVSKEELEQVSGRAVPPAAAPGSTSLASPGLLGSHYAPRKPLALLPGSILEIAPQALEAAIETTAPTSEQGQFTLGLLQLSGAPESAREALLSLLAKGRYRERITQIEVRTLSVKASPDEMARNLFRELRALDESRADALVSESCISPSGLEFAIMDRLKRASATKS